MDDPNGSEPSRDRRLIPVVLLGLGLVIAGIAYRFSDDLIAFVQSATSGTLGHPQSRSFHY
ncbi:MAG TPA: hypothetical protein VG269_02775 [Tepidisphaeraceae bacterium]|jgi:hypothetical protein|nr:hypothetical protein [Tepidisphaeraceae bacterium]